MNIRCYIINSDSKSFQELMDYVNRTPGMELVGLETDALSLSPRRRCFYIHGGGKGKFIRIITDDIVFLESTGNYTKINLEHKLHIIHRSLKEMEQLLQADHFKRIHKSFIVNMDKVVSVEGNIIQLSNGNKVDIGPNYQKDFFEYIFPPR